MTTPLVRATFDLRLEDLPSLALEVGDLPPRYGGFTRTREEELDNRAMAARGFESASEERFRGVGRIGGFVREFWSASASDALDGEDVMAGTVVHLFDTPQGVSEWMRDVFVRDFTANVGSDASEGQRLVSADRFEPQGFYDEAVGVRAVYEGRSAPVSASIIDFRIGRVLGVAYVATIGDHNREEESAELGIALEKAIVGGALWV